jgi:excisionase family DNA binding protein
VTQSRLHNDQQCSDAGTEEGDTKDTIKMQALTTPAEAGRLLKVHAKTVIKLAREGELPGFRIGKHWRFRNSDLEAWAENRIQSPRQPAE